jgi:hypothetical protein
MGNWHSAGVKSIFQWLDNAYVGFCCSTFLATIKPDNASGFIGLHCTSSLLLQAIKRYQDYMLTKYQYETGSVWISWLPPT